MKNKGFTLVELLGVIVILAIILLIVFPNVINLSKKESKELDDKTKRLVYNAAEIVVKENIDYYPKDNNEESCLTIQELIGYGYLINEINIENQSIINTKAIKIKYDESYDESSAEYDYYNDNYGYKIIDAETCAFIKILPSINKCKSDGNCYICTSFSNLKSLDYLKEDVYLNGENITNTHSYDLDENKLITNQECNDLKKQIVYYGFENFVTNQIKTMPVIRRTTSSGEILENGEIVRKGSNISRSLNLDKYDNIAVTPLNNSINITEKNVQINKIQDDYLLQSQFDINCTNCLFVLGNGMMTARANKNDSFYQVLNNNYYSLTLRKKSDNTIIPASNYSFNNKNLSINEGVIDDTIDIFANVQVTINSYYKVKPLLSKNYSLYSNGVESQDGTKYIFVASAQNELKINFEKAEISKVDVTCDGKKIDNTKYELKDNILTIDKSVVTGNLSITPTLWYEPTIYNRMVPIIYVETDSTNYTHCDSTCSNLGRCSNSSSYGYWKIIDPSKTEWYNYDNQKWANVAILKDGVSSAVDTKIKLSDTWGIYVWIPRYEYYLTSSMAYDEIIPANIITKKNYEITDGYVVSPAFNVYDSSTNTTKEISGFWISKFALVEDDYHNYYSLPDKATDFNNLETLHELSNYTSYSKKISLDGLYDSHAMKLSEWGALNYLVHTKYGKFGNYYANDKNSSSPHPYGVSLDKTGRSNGNYSTSYNGAGTYLYDNNLNKDKVCSINSGNTLGSSSINATGGFIVSDNKDSFSVVDTTNSSATYTETIKFTVPENKYATVSFNYQMNHSGVYLSTKKTTFKYSITDVSNSSGSLSNSDTKKSVSIGPISSGTYTLNLTFTKNTSKAENSRSVNVTNFKVTYGDIKEEIVKYTKNGIGASSTGNVYGVYDMNYSYYIALISYNSGSTDYGSNSFANISSKYFSTGFNKKYYDKIETDTSSSSNILSCNDSNNCKGYGLKTEIPASFYSDCENGQSLKTFYGVETSIVTVFSASSTSKSIFCLRVDPGSSVNSSIRMVFAEK